MGVTLAAVTGLLLLFAVLAAADGDLVWGGVFFAMFAVPNLIVVARLRGRYGPAGRAWAVRLRSVATEPREWHDVDIWLGRANHLEGKGAQLAFVAEPGGSPRRSASLIPGSALERSGGRGRAWGTPRRGEPMLLELGGEPLWASAPTHGRVATWLNRGYAATVWGVERPD